eukprot:11542264-Karenia_brevis.AAC.1
MVAIRAGPKRATPIMDPTPLSSSAHSITCEDMCIIAGVTTPQQQDAPMIPPPPTPPGQLRATRPKRRGSFRLRPQDHYEGPLGIMRLRDMFTLAGYEVSDNEEDVILPPLPDPSPADY